MNYSKWCDDQGYPGCRQADGSFDGGDTAAIMGTIRALSPDLTALIIEPLKADPPFDYVYRQPLRHPNTKVWYGMPYRYSRDQLIAMLCGAILSGQKIGNVWVAHKRRFLLTAWNELQNDGSAKSFPASLGDICGPEVWALWIRYFNPWWGFLVLWFLDIQTLVGAVQWRYFTPETNQICRNHMLVCLTMRATAPSLITKYIERINAWPDLIARWRASNEATGEFPTADLFDAAHTRIKPA